jgi:hypothetical protein
MYLGGFMAQPQAVEERRSGSQIREIRRTAFGLTIGLLVQFGLGMFINLFVQIPSNHPGAKASEFFSGVGRSVTWAIGHGAIALSIHAVLGLVLVLGSISLAVRGVRSGRRVIGWVTSLGAVAILAAGFNGGSFLNYNEDVNSLLMASFFGAGVLCYAVVLFVTGEI